MITTFDLPQEIVSQAQDVAMARKTTLQALVVEGLRSVLRVAVPATTSEEALVRLRKGYPLGGGKPLSRDEVHAR